MGKHFWLKHLDDESHVKQPGCMWGLVHVLDYHHWQSNVRKIIQHRKYEGGTHNKCDWSPERSMYHRDAYEAETLLDEEQSQHFSTKRSRATKKRSLKARIKALIAEEISKESKNTRDKRGFPFKPNLQRTYSIHHLESIDDGSGKIRRDWKHPIIFLPENVENHSSQSYDTNQMTAAGHLEASGGERVMHSPDDAAKLDSKEDPDVFEIFKVDKELLLKHLQDSDESIANFSRSAFGLNTKAKFSKSRSFPVDELAQKRKLKPLKLESKQKEVWSFPREDKFQTVNRASRLDGSDYVGTRSGELAGDESNGISGQDIMNKEDKQRDNAVIVPSDDANREANNAMDRIVEKPEENGIRKYTHRRSSSLNESLDKYARLFENSFGKDAKLNSSKSLKLTNEYGHAPWYFRRIRSVSNVDSYYSNLSLEVFGDNPFGNDLVVIAKYSSSCLQNSEEEKGVSLPISDKEDVPLDVNMQTKEDDARRLHTRDGNCEKADGLEEEADELKKSYFLREKDTKCSDVANKELQDQGLNLVSDVCLQETESHALELQISQGLEYGSRVHELNSSIDSNDPKSLQGMLMLTYGTYNLENDINFKGDGCPKKKNSDLDYVRHLLDQSGIAMDASGVTWHASNQPLSPQLFEEVEAGWHHEQDQLNGWPDFCGCWHHQMLFDLVNEVLVELFDTSLPYYPKALSSSCHVRPFPMGNRIIEEVCTSIETLLNTKSEEMHSLDRLVAHDLAHDHSWMNLQLDTEFIALDLEDMIFNELLQEVIFS